jgi:hypothetical protein
MAVMYSADLFWLAKCYNTSPVLGLVFVNHIGMLLVLHFKLKKVTSFSATERCTWPWTNRSWPPSPMLSLPSPNHDILENSLVVATGEIESRLLGNDLLRCSRRASERTIHIQCTQSNIGLGVLWWHISLRDRSCVLCSISTELMYIWLT